MFEDHFGPVATAYARFRPRYPTALFERIARAAPGHRRCWDCATGNGQAAVGLAAYFDEVVATDASARQLAVAEPHDRVTYRRESADTTALPDASVDAITVAAALHWLPRPAFYAEVKRVAVPGAVVAAWTYSTVVQVGSAAKVEALIDGLVHTELKPHWTPAFQEVSSGYRSVDFPFVPLSVPPIAIEADWTLAQLLGHVDTWSAAARYRAEHGREASLAIAHELEEAWGPPETVRRVRIPLHVRMGRVSGSAPGA